MFSIPTYAMPIRQQESAALIQRERETFARNLKQARKQAGLTQEDLARVTNLTQGFISDVENAKCSVSLDNANILAAAVKQPLNRLLIS
jgi:transcriptional regulator with XRE-family HTH domain